MNLFIIYFFNYNLTPSTSTNLLYSSKPINYTINRIQKFRFDPVITFSLIGQICLRNVILRLANHDPHSWVQIEK